MRRLIWFRVQGMRDLTVQGRAEARRKTSITQEVNHSGVRGREARRSGLDSL